MSNSKKNYGTDFLCVDLLHEMVETLMSKPQIFQRNGVLYLATTNGFGAITPALDHSDDQRPNFGEIVIPSLDILLSDDVLVKDEKRLWGLERPFLSENFSNGEKKYFNAVTSSTTAYEISINEIANAANLLSKLPDDGKIRIVEEHNNEHSAGLDTKVDHAAISSARVMDKKVYLALLKKREEGAYLGTGEFSYLRKSKEQYPNCFILTPHIFLSFPFKISLTFEGFLGQKHGLSKPYDCSENIHTRNIIGEACSSDIHINAQYGKQLEKIAIESVSTGKINENSRLDNVLRKEIEIYHQFGERLDEIARTLNFRVSVSA